jgi:uncharacterized protein (DUF433 family)
MTIPLDKISIDSNLGLGKPCIKGTRIWVSIVLDFLADGESETDILPDDLQQSSTDIQAASDPAQLS